MFDQKANNKAKGTKSMEAMWRLTGGDVMDLLLDLKEALEDTVPVTIGIDDGELKFKVGEGMWSVGRGERL